MVRVLTTTGRRARHGAAGLLGAAALLLAACGSSTTYEPASADAVDPVAATGTAPEDTPPPIGDLVAIDVDRGVNATVLVEAAGVTFERRTIVARYGDDGGYGLVAVDELTDAGEMLTMGEHVVFDVGEHVVMSTSYVPTHVDRWTEVDAPEDGHVRVERSRMPHVLPPVDPGAVLAAAGVGPQVTAVPSTYGELAALVGFAGELVTAVDALADPATAAVALEVERDGGEVVAWSAVVDLAPVSGIEGHAARISARAATIDPVEGVTVPDAVDVALP